LIGKITINRLILKTMATKNLEKLTRRSGYEPVQELTFETVENDSNILKAQVLKGGKTHQLFVLAVPEDNIEDYNDEEFRPVFVEESEIA